MFQVLHKNKKPPSGHGDDMSRPKDMQKTSLCLHAHWAIICPKKVCIKKKILKKKRWDVMSPITHWSNNRRYTVSRKPAEFQLMYFMPALWAGSKTFKSIIVEI